MFVKTRLAIAVETWRDISTFEPAPVMAEVHVPTIFIHGADDEFTPTSASEESASVASRGTVAVADDCGHLVMLDQREWFQTTLETFLTESR
jgi:pimeloyl-ACP methyl ester carboxylesterase